MAKDPRWDQFFDAPDPVDQQHPADELPSRREARAAEGHSRDRPGGPRRDRTQRVDRHGITVRKRTRRFTWLWVLLSIVVVLGLATAAVNSTFGPQLRSIFGQAAPIDYTGDGIGRVVITIQNGQIGGDIATVLQKAGVTKTYTAFYSLLLKQVPPVQFQPGSYALKKGMSAQAALTALTDPKNKILTELVLPEGITVKGVVAKLGALSDSTGVTLAQLQAAVADYKTYGLPAEAPSLEGYLFPATYNLNPGEDAHQIIQGFVTQMFDHLNADGVAVADRHRILTLAALTQKEGGSDADYLKVARVWDNRLAAGMKLQSDATVSYGAHSSGIETTAAQRADKSNPYNTYANAGLPVGPISNPGDAAIRATLNPAPGDWLYFVVVNCSTKETAFSTTVAQHDAAVAQWRAWMKANPGGCN